MSKFSTAILAFHGLRPVSRVSSVGGVVDGRGRGASVAHPLPCLSSNNCTENSSSVHQTLQNGHKKTADLLRKSIESLAETYGIERIGFLTLTFSEHIVEVKEAQRRWHSLRTHVLKKRYSAVVRILERQASGRIHYHCLVALPSDVRTGADFVAFGKGDYRSANDALREEWAFWRITAPRYRFGRTELLPVKSNAEGISKYVGKYVSKHIGQREERDKGARLVEYSRSARIGNTAFAWNNAMAMVWRAKVSSWAAKHGCASLEDVKVLFGRHWAYLHREAILGMDWSLYVPTFELSVALCAALRLPPSWGPLLAGGAFGSRGGTYFSETDEWLREVGASFAQGDRTKAQDGFDSKLHSEASKKLENVLPEASPERFAEGTMPKSAKRAYLPDSPRHWNFATLRKPLHEQKSLRFGLVSSSRVPFNEDSLCSTALRRRRRNRDV